MNKQFYINDIDLYIDYIENSKDAHELIITYSSETEYKGTIYNGTHSIRLVDNNMCKDNHYVGTMIYYILRIFDYFPNYKYTNIEFPSASLFFSYENNYIYFIQKRYEYDNNDIEKLRIPKVSMDATFSPYIPKLLSIENIYNKFIEVLWRLNNEVYHSKYLEFRKRYIEENKGIDLGTIYDDLELRNHFDRTRLENSILKDRSVFELSHEYVNYYVSYDAEKEELIITDKTNINNICYFKRVYNKNKPDLILFERIDKR